MSEDNSSPTEDTSLLIRPIDTKILDTTSGVEGFVADEVEQAEREIQRQQPHKTYTTDLERQISATDSTEVEEEPLSVTKTRIVIASMYVGIFLAALDSTIVTTLVTHISSEFNSLEKLPWIATSYLLSSTTCQPLYGKISDIFGRRCVLIFCNLTFMIGCFLCAIAPTVDWLIFGRLVSGIGGAGLTSLSSITTSDLIPLKERGIYQGLGNVNFGVGTATGALIGGLFASTPALGGWRGAFWVQVPISLASLVSIYLLLHLPKNSIGYGSNEDVCGKLQSIDWLGSFTLVSFLLLFLFGSSLGGKEIPFDSLTFKLIVIGTVLLLYAFIKAELAAKNPILPVRFMTIPTVVGVSLSNFFLSMSTFTLFFMVPVYFSAVLNLDARQIGDRFAPNFLSTISGSLGAGLYMKRTGKYRQMIILASFISVAGVYRVVCLSPSYTVFEQYILFICPGIGGSIVITATLLALIAAVPHKHQAATTSISYLFRSCGSTLGVSVGSAIFNWKLSSELLDRVLQFQGEKYDRAFLLDIVEHAIHSTEYVHAGAPEFVRQALVDSFSAAAKLTFQFCLASTVFALASVFLIKEHVLHGSIKR
ncbi:hypothetical protein WICPIJ_009613 [Wickerhamomyces pijperi]|uniref:Major facilitator superfamily (MFS) profile domain-containing protein n=1 Tax=Wickerhamomyces pijperi TaxID=599730 RepID=A0A9P8TD92_WICPI|nr:hypothetical protein WICPIJ_009613 [Wickerhamomyces pijperi]